MGQERSKATSPERVTLTFVLSGYSLGLHDICTNADKDLNLRPFNYARLLGQLQREQDGSLSIKVIQIRRLVDAHEIFYHLLQVIFDTICLEKGAPVSGYGFCFVPRSLISIQLCSGPMISQLSGLGKLT